MLAALVLTASVSASPPPLKTITHARSTPFCTAFEENVRRTVQGVLVNDSLFQRTEPVFLKAATDMVSGGAMVSSFDSMHAAQPDPDNASVHLDMARFEELGGTIAKNLQVINDLLNDRTRFPANAKTEDEKRLMKLRAQLLALAKKQNAELNVLLGTTDQYLFDSFANAYPTVNDATGHAKSPEAGYLSGGRLKSPGDLADASLASNGIFMNSAMGAMYRTFMQQVAQEQAAEPELARTLEEDAKSC
ncbi:MAG TPA: hypothetical protein VFH72_14910 [Candidatus Baltobacteraceae bacterium]|nr:hypothetical protein [Candidatus Baltobacteraceae bacterium]